MIVDANVAIYWCVETPLTAPATAILERSDLIAPGFIKLEVTHALFKYLRAGLISSAQLREGVSGVSDAISEFVDDGHLLGGATEIALAENHPVYDCLYLALASERRDSFATADRRLATLARKRGIETTLVEPKAE